METIKKGISGSTLKMIAIVTMLIDHIAAAGIGRVLLQNEIVGDYQQLYQIYWIMRMIGRIAFPIFCFLLIEGFLYTRDRKKYAMRLGIFALVSEVPFDLAFNAKILEFGYQNVFFTLFLGLLTVMAFDAIRNRTDWDKIIKIGLYMVSIMAGMGAATLLRTDYSARGVMCIMALYLFCWNRKFEILAGAASFFWWEPQALLAFVPIYFYNGKRGWNIKYIFYLFYPVHLLLIYAVCCIMGNNTISVV